MTEPKWLWTARDQRLFLEALAESGDPAAAATKAGQSLETAHRMRDRSPEFDAGWHRALGIAWEQVEMRLLAKLLKSDAETIDTKVALAMLQRRAGAGRGLMAVDPMRVTALRNEIRARAQ